MSLAASSILPSAASAGGPDVTLDPAVDVTTASPSLPVVTGDVDADGDLDVVTLAAGRPIVLRNEGGTLVPGRPIGNHTIEVRGIELADVTGDGRVDIVGGGPGTVLAYAGAGDGAFAPPIVSATNHEQALDIAVTDVDGDGDVDVLIPIVRTGRMATFRNDGTGRFTAGTSFFLGGSTLAFATQPVTVLVADVNRDGRRDVVAALSTWGVSVLLGTATGFTVRVVSTVPAWDVAAGDVDGDGLVDVVSVYDGVLTTITGNGDGTFDAPASLVVGGRAQYAAVADLDRDRPEEIVVTGGVDCCSASGRLVVVDDGAVEVAMPLRWRGGLVAAGDLGGDGLADLVVGGDWWQGTSVAAIRNATPIANLPPQVTVTGVLAGAAYEVQSVPEAWCDVVDPEDGSLSFPATLDAEVDAFGLGTASASCSYVDTGGLRADATATYDVVDTIAPTIAGTVDDGPGWHRDDVTVSWACADSGTGVAACPAPTVVAGEGSGLSASGSAVDNAGNEATVVVGGIDIDRTAPVITWSGASAYTVDQTIVVSCVATDALSGLASVSCPSAGGPATTAGTFELVATATDVAGNTTTSTFSYRVDVTHASLGALAQSFADGKAGGLVSTLDAALAAGERGSQQAADRQLDAFRRQVAAQAGKSLTAEEAALLIELSREL